MNILIKINPPLCPPLDWHTYCVLKQIPSEKNPYTPQICWIHWDNGMAPLMHVASHRQTQSYLCSHIDRVLFWMIVCGERYVSCSVLSSITARKEESASLCQLWGLGCWELQMHAFYWLNTSSKILNKKQRKTWTLPRRIICIILCEFVSCKRRGCKGLF